MTTELVFVTADQGVDECMALMTRNRIHHLPIMKDEKVLGLVSIGDLVKWVVSEQEETIRQSSTCKITSPPDTPPNKSPHYAPGNMSGR